ncbi:hypothetical protein SPRG_20199 [Saprolegnia parasitica CBS 223.65]|uniref:Uncharacterized protein n=1 Tax=Saprolegnia parasitica (strain CBS 223.65) TaxID=695850 RepID=A0A067CC03_SAPPC|nr:hypothetical protein SPRG_20199 [Saprolegnia parasitica CBS 223.65]KDO28038.1 hypothetical protein SPRG_20199 [Saprolegnia parasitica CBS 223.65]|eukprot:XP_012201190.1 hypothetical protein SPRG_20199 [Saprolegnia parasitica CBS 223.65]
MKLQSIASLTDRLATTQSAVTACETASDLHMEEIKDLTAKVKRADELAQMAETKLLEEARTCVKAQQALTEYKRQHIAALAQEVERRESVEKEVSVHKAAQATMSAELREHQEAVDLLKSELAREIARGLSLQQDVIKYRDDVGEMLASYEHLKDEHKALNYLAARSNDLGEMRPELKAALAKARSVIRVPEDVAAAVAQGKNALLQSHENIRSNVAPIVGDSHATSATVVVVGVLMAPPIYVVAIFVRSLQRRIQAQHVVLVLNFLAMCFFGAVGASSVVLDTDVFRSLQTSSPSGYILLQLLMLGFFLVHSGTSVLFLFCAAPIKVQVAGAVHVLVSLGVVVHYYEHIWAKAMLDMDHPVHAGTFFAYAFVYLLGLGPALLAAAYEKVRDAKRS